MALDFSKVRFLVVDDHEPSIKIVRTLLKTLGAREVISAHALADGLARMDAEKFDMVILDLLLGRDDGIELLKAIRNEGSRHAFMPVLVLSAYTERGRVEAARDAGANEVVAKPVAAVELYRKILAIVEEPRMFVRTDAYFGPDRRRRVDEDYRGPERRSGATTGLTDNRADKA